MTKSLEALITRKENAVIGSYYLAKCENCEEMFSSGKMTGGEPLYSGDYGDSYCPHCGVDDSEISDCGNDALEAWNFQQKYIDALISELEHAQRANAAQDDHINQQADRIHQLEKKNAELGGQLSRYSMSPGQADQRMCESRAVRDALGFGKDADNVAPADLRNHIDEMKARIAELEARPLCVKLPDELDGKSFEYIANKFQVPMSAAQWVLVGWNACRAAGGTVEGD